MPVHSDSEAPTFTKMKIQPKNKIIDQLNEQMHNYDNGAADVNKEQQLEEVVPEQMLYAKLDYKPTDKLLVQLGLRFMDDLDD